MQYLLLIYDEETRWTKLGKAGKMPKPASMAPFGKEFAGAIRGGNGLQPTSTAKTVRRSNARRQIAARKVRRPPNTPLPGMDDIRSAADPFSGGSREGSSPVRYGLPVPSILRSRRCCHPALNPEAQVALTLRTLGGLSTPEIARVFLLPEAPLAQRLVRAKRKIQEAHIPYEIPPPNRLPERLGSVQKGRRRRGIQGTCAVVA